MNPTRRHLLSSGMAVGTIASLVSSAGASASDFPHKLKIVVSGGHPGDPEAACGGTMARFADMGHEVVALYLTCGECGLQGKTQAEAAAIRTGEGQRACAMLKARALFLNQADADTVVSVPRYEEFRHSWQQKSHMSFLRTGRSMPTGITAPRRCWFTTPGSSAAGSLPCYYEVSTGEETQHFHPTDYVNIAATESRKRAACFLHASQQPAKFYAYHEKMHGFRGFEAGCQRAEAFVHHEQSPAVQLPG